MWLKWFRFEFRMELATKEVGMVRDFDDLNVGSVRSRSGDPQPAAGQQRLIFPIEFVTMPMTFTNFSLTIGVRGDRICFELAFPCA